MEEENEFLAESKTVEDSISITLPKLRNWKIDSFYEFEENIFDYESLEDLNRAILTARKSLFRITEKINEVERREVSSSLAYQREYRRKFLESNHKTETMKKEYAALQTEHLENDAVIFSQVKKELLRTSSALKEELSTLNTMANNLRQQMKME